MIRSIAIAILVGVILGTGYDAYETTQDTARHTLTLGMLRAEPRELEATSGHCGVERWAVKVVTDGAVINLAPVRTKIVTLDAMPVPSGMNRDAGRLAEEHQAYQLTGTRLIADKLEGDSDYHLVLQSPTGQTMIAEIPDPACAQGSSVLAQITKARAYYDATFGPASGSFRSINRTINITGIGMFDVKHGQTGVAPNGAELHPTLSIRTLP